MSNADKLKKRAAEFESKRQNDKAIAAYLELFDEWDGEDLANIEVGLFNRAGDLMLREGSVGDAVSVWERAVDLYADGGFQNNAIALCNKILRNSPGRASIYYKLGKISAQKGFRGDAKKNFLEYADRKQKANEIDEAFRALKEFADLCPEEDDIRQMLAEQLSKLGRNDEALEQLQLLYGRYEHDGDSAAATATLERMRAIDPAAEPNQRRGPRRSAGVQGLVFLDLEEPQPGARSVAPAPARPPAAPAPDLEVTISDASLVEIEPAPIEVEPMAGFEPTAVDGPAVDESILAPAADEPGEVGDGSLLGLETTVVEGAETAADADSIDLAPLEIEGQGIDTDVPPADGLELIPEFSVDDVSALEPVSLDGPDAPSVGGGVEFIVTDDEDAVDIDLDTDADADGTEAPAERGSGLAFIALDDDDDPSVGDNGPLDDDDLDGPDPAYADLPMLEDVPIPRRATRSTMSVMAQSVDLLALRVEGDPTNWQLRREYGEALLEDGERERGVAELEAALVGFEERGDLDTARSVADELIRLSPHSVRLHQKRVEYAVRLADRPRLLEAYLQLADALFQAGQPDKARVVYARVLELAPEDRRALAALETLGEVVVAAPDVPPEPVAPPEPAGHVVAAPVVDVVGAAPAAPDPQPAAAPVAPPSPAAADDEFVSLGDWLREDDGPKSTRMVVEEEAPSGDEDADFKDMLRKFKQGVAENVEEEDHESHYDLGVAFKEMGLMDEAIAEFQKALRGTANRARTYESLGQCFVEKGQTQVAMTILQRALSEPGVGDDQLVGVLYLLGDGAEILGQPADAIKYFQRVFAVDIMFRDVGDRLNRLEQVRG